LAKHIIVLGGGVIGLSCAWACRNRGWDVTVLETRECGGQASGAAAGMLAPYWENAEGADAFFHLGLKSLRMFPDWRKEIRRLSEIDFEYTACGSLLLAFHDADVLALEERLAWQRDYGMNGEIVQGEALYKMEPHISRDAVAALYNPEEAHIYAPDYVLSLKEACRRSGVRIEERLEKLDIVEWQSSAVVRSAQGSVFEADILVLSNGAWSQQYEETFGVRIPVFPIRGQICAYKAPVHPIRHMVYGSQGYLVAKANGTLVSGASEDVAGFATDTTEKGISRLKKWNGKMLPELIGAEPFHTWAGLRPATQDGFPLIGRLSSAGHVIFATGHYRNGILLSAATGDVVADLVEGKANEPALAPFAPERFGYIA